MYCPPKEIYIYILVYAYVILDFFVYNFIAFILMLCAFYVQSKGILQQ